MVERKKDPESLQAPVGLDLETVAEQLLSVKHAERDVEEVPEKIPIDLSPLETAIHQNLKDDSELEIASWLNKLATRLEEHNQKQIAQAVRGRARTLASKELNELDGFDR